MLDEVDDVLGVFPLVDRNRGRAGGLSDDEQRMLAERESARTEGRWADADRIRTDLAGRGIIIEDTAGGQRWRRA